MRLLAIVVLCGLVSCKTVEPALVTRDAIVVADKTFLAIAQVMRVLEGQLTEAQWQSWTLFELRFKTSFHAARVLYDDAVTAQLAALAVDGGTDPAAGVDLRAAESVIANFVAQLAEWQRVIDQLTHPDGGVP